MNDLDIIELDAAELIRVRGLVQGVGFRPTVWRLARRYGLRGWVTNDGDGVSIRVCGSAAAIDGFIDALPSEAPPLARIDRIERAPSQPSSDDAAFSIVASIASEARTGVVPDAATCAQCRAEALDPFARRYRYPFTNCTHCGPRAWLGRSDGRAMPLAAITTLDAVDGAASLLMRGQFLAIKSLGGFQLACGNASSARGSRSR